MDPNVESDIYADKPWALSPMVASMNNLSIGTKTSGTTVKESHDGLDGMSLFPNSCCSDEVPTGKAGQCVRADE